MTSVDRVKQVAERETEGEVRGGRTGPHRCHLNLGTAGNGP